MLSGSIEGVFDDFLGSVQKKRLQVLVSLLSEVCSATFDAVDGVGYGSYLICFMPQIICFLEVR